MLSSQYVPSFPQKLKAIYISFTKESAMRRLLIIMPMFKFEFETMDPFVVYHFAPYWDCDTVN